MISYDVYKRPNGLMYRVRLDLPLRFEAELFLPRIKRWILSYHSIGGIVSSDNSTLVARNVVFKD